MAARCKAATRTKTQVKTQTPLLSTPTGGEPVQPRRRSLLRRRSGALRALNITATRSSSKRGLRSTENTLSRIQRRRLKQKLSRAKFRQFKRWYLDYCMYRGSKARETWEQQRRKRKTIWKNTKREDISRMFPNYKLPTGGGNNHVKLAYSKPLKVATLNVRGMKSENAMTKGALIADIMKKQHYDTMLLQETNENTKSVRTIQGFDFYFSTDIKQEEILKTKTRIEEAKANGKGTSSIQKTDVERAGVAIVVSPQIRPFCQGCTPNIG